MEKDTEIILSFEDKEKLIKALVTDFQLNKAWEIRKELHNLKDIEVKPIGLKVIDFIKYEDKRGEFKHPLLDYLTYILKYIKILCNKNMLTSIPSTGLPWLEEQYTSIMMPLDEEYWKRITSYADILGIDYLYYKLSKYEAHIEVVNERKEVHSGSGTLIAPGVILTCRHVVEPEKFQISRIEINGQIYETKKLVVSEKKDIALVYIKGCQLEPVNDIIFGEAKVLEDIITFGYPAIPMLREAPLITQKGEINAVTRDFYNRKCLIISSIVRPGNSGGAIISKDGLYVGMVSDFKERHSLEDKIKVDKTLTAQAQIESMVAQINTLPQLVPFYSGIATEEIVDEIKKLDPELRFTTV